MTEVTVFGMTNCAGCEVVKRLLSENKIEFSYIDVMDPDKMAKAQELGIRGVPTTIVHEENGNTVIVGSTQQALTEIRRLTGLQ